MATDPKLIMSSLSLASQQAGQPRGRVAETGGSAGLHNLGNTRDAVQASTENDRQAEECIGARISPQ